MELPLNSEFYYRDKHKSNGFSSQCKKCVLEYHQKTKDKISLRAKQYYIENKEKINNHGKQYRINNSEKEKARRIKYCENNRELRNARNRLYVELNKEKERTRHHLYYEKNRLLINAKNNQWGRENRIIKTISTQRYRAKSKSILCTLTKEQWEYIKLQFDNKCAYCGKEAILTQDHFIPQENDGEYTHNNIIPSCKSCNSSKHQKNFFEWYPKYKYYSKTRENKILKFLDYKNGVQQLELVETKIYSQLGNN